MKAPEEQEASMKTGNWLKLIMILNLVVAACLIALATALLAHFISPGTTASIETIFSLPLLPFAWLIFRYSGGSILGQIPIWCLAGLAAAGGFGLRRRLNWARRCTIVLYLLCMAYMTPVVLFVALSNDAIWEVPLGLALFIGVPAAIVWYLLQPELKEVMGVSNQNFSRAKFTSMIALATIGSLLFFFWLFRIGLEAMARGLR